MQLDEVNRLVDNLHKASNLWRFWLCKVGTIEKPYLHSGLSEVHSFGLVSTFYKYFFPAILSAGAPDLVPFMADETMMAIPDLGEINYHLPFYMKYMEKINKVLQPLKKKGKEIIIISQCCSC